MECARELTRAGLSAGQSWLLSLLLVIPLSLRAEPPTQPSPRPKIGVALQGGGAKGLAHIGVLQWFEDHHIPIDYLAGTSMGGLIGGLYATGRSAAEIQDIVKDTDWGQVLSGETPYRSLSFRRKEDLRAFPNGLEIGLRSGVQLPGGLNSGQSVRFIVDRYLLPYSDRKSFDDLPIPFRCVATDLVSEKAVVLKDGSLANALRATMSIPGVFSPVREGDKIYADGGLLNNLPTDVVKQMGADIVIGVHLTTGPVIPKNLKSMFQVAAGSNDVMIDANELRGMERADILITVNLTGYTTLEFSRVQEIIPKGVEAAQSKAQVLARLSLDDKDWKSYLAQRESRKVNSVHIPQFVAVEGTNKNLSHDIEEQLSYAVGEPIDTGRLQQELTQLVGRGRFSSLSYSQTDRNGTPGLRIDAEEKDYAPPWIKPGFVVDGSDPNNVQFAFGSRITFLDVGGYRSEIRADFSIGSIYSGAAEWYHPLTPTSRFFIAPQVNASRSPLNLYFKTDLLAAYKLNSVYGGFDIGYAFNRFSELRLGYQLGYLSADRWIGSPLLPTVSGRTGTTRVRYAMDRLDNPIIPRSGIALLSDGGWVDANPGATGQFPVAELNIAAFRPVSRPSSVYLLASGGTTFGHNGIGLPQFALGGPTRLAAYGVNELLANQYFYFGGGYLHRIGALSPILGSDIYFNARLEVAKSYGLLNGSQVPKDAAVGVIMQTILGPVLIGGSIGDSGHHKWFFQLGRVF